MAEGQEQKKHWADELWDIIDERIDQRVRAIIGETVQAEVKQAISDIGQQIKLSTGIRHEDRL